MDSQELRNLQEAYNQVHQVEENNDLFDYILEYLVAEGYADTNEAAIAIMANMSEEWRDSIVESPRSVVGSTPSDVVRDRLDDRRAYRSRVTDAMAQGTSPVGLRRRELAQQREKEFNAYRKKQDQDPYYKIKTFKDIPGTFPKK